MKLPRGLKVNPVTGGIARTLTRSLCGNIESYIFVASTGRSGTQSLCKIGQAVDDCCALHEPKPIFHADVLQRYNQGDQAFMEREFRLRKLPYLYWSARGKRWYLETNHMFIKCFAEAAVKEFGRKLQVVHVVRDADAVANSFYHRDDIPGTTKGNRWMLDYHWPRNVLNMQDTLAERQFSHPYFRCMWYWYEIEARTVEFHKKHPQVPIHTIRTEQFNDREAVVDLFETLGLPVTDQVLGKIGTRANASSKTALPPEGISPEDIQAFHQRCSKQFRDTLNRDPLGASD